MDSDISEVVETPIQNTYSEHTNRSSGGGGPPHSNHMHRLQCIIRQSQPQVHRQGDQGHRCKPKVQTGVQSTVNVVIVITKVTGSDGEVIFSEAFPVHMGVV